MASNKQKQRRGKKDGGKPTSLNDELEKAETAVVTAKLQTDAIHDTWRGFLFLVSTLIVLINLYNSRAPMKACSEDIKAVNQVLKENHIIGWRMVVVLVSDSMVDVLSFVMASSLSFFVQKSKPRATFGSSSYLLASACAVPIVILYFFRRDPQSTTGCVDHLLDQAGLQPSSDETRPFPVVLIFHVVVTVCYMFMQMQSNQDNKNILAIIQLRKDLEAKGEVKKEQ